MRLKIVDGDRVGGYGAFGNLNYPKYEWENPLEELRDKYGKLIYRWDGKDVIYDPITPTIEELEVEKQEATRRKITEQLPDILLNLTSEEGFEKVKNEVDKIKVSVETKK